jgi:glutamate 5-kinase
MTMPEATFERQADLQRVRRVVVKVGSAVISRGGKLRPDAIESLAGDVAELKGRGYEVVMVVSGAVAGGFAALGLSHPPTAVVERQAAACIGQYKLMSTFADAFGACDVRVAQLLMMEEDIENRRRFLSARHTLQLLIDEGIVPIINQNDALSDDENSIGDNDHLSALVVNVVSAHLLVIFSSVAGLYRGGVDGDVIGRVDVGASMNEHVVEAVSECGVGGMEAKVAAAHMASRWGVPTIIADGTQPGMLTRVVTGEPVGTMFMPYKSTLTSRKRWIAFRRKSHGVISVDDGARDAVVDRGASLLPSGIVKVEGRFSMGARVDIQDASGHVFAVGLVSYSSHETRLMKGRKQTEFQKVLGYEYVGEIIGRDDMVLLNGVQSEGADA